MTNIAETPLIPADLHDQLVANWRAGQAAEDQDKSHDPLPTVKLHMQLGPAVWLFTEAVEDHPDTLFGLCDLGMGFPELGYASLSEIAAVRLGGVFKVVRDLSFAPTFPLSVYAEAARLNSAITFDEKTLLHAKALLDADKKRGKK